MEKLIENIIDVIGNTSLTNSFFEKVLNRLQSLGYEMDEQNDGWLIAFATEKVQNYIKNECNILDVGSSLINIMVDRVCGEFLFTKKQTGQLTDMFNLEVAVKQIQTGDSNVTFALEGSQTNEQQLNSLISNLRYSGEGELVCYRKLKW